jgi:hypothetical protein
MSATYAGYSNLALTLSGTIPIDTIALGATIAADGLLGTYGVQFLGGSVSLQPFYGAVFGAAGTNFTLTNLGLIENTRTVLSTGANYGVGVLFGGGGEVINAGTILGGANAGVFMETTGTVINSGVINDGTLNGEGGVTILQANGAYVDNAASASIYGAFGLYFGYGAATVVNAGVITGRYIGVFDVGEGISITNLGTIAVGANPIQDIAIDGSASIVNGSATDTTAVIAGGIMFSTSSIDANGAPKTLASTGVLTNFGTVGAVAMQAGQVVNGSNTDTNALVRGEVSFNQGGLFANYGTLVDSATIGDEVRISNGGTLINGSASDSTALITAASLALGISLGKTTSFTNYGTIVGGTITGIYQQSGVMVNDGTIIGNSHSAGSSAALLMGAYGNATVTNNGLVEGRLAVSGFFPAYKYNDTLINSGSIISTLGTAGFAVKMGSGTNLLVDESTGVFVGIVQGGTGVNVLELASAASAGTVSGFGSLFTEFSTVSIDTNARWVIDGSYSNFGTTTIEGFASLDTIMLDGATFAQANETYVAGVGLELNNGTQSVTLDVAGSFASADFVVAASATGTKITLAVPCFARGTRLRTPSGQVAVELLRAGDVVSTAGGPKPVRWIGTRAYEGRFIEGNKMALPVRIRRHALGFNVPSRDLVVSPGHAMVLDGQLVHAWRLLNGVSVTQAEHVAAVAYYHLDFGTHEVIFAENAPTESFRDENCRGQFQNEASAPPCPVPPRCLPVLEEGYALARLAARLATRAGVVARTPRGSAGPLVGFIDSLAPRLTGWAVDKAAQDEPVELDVLYDGQFFARILANFYRPDLRAAGFGDGCHGFTLALPGDGAVAVRRTRDLAPLGPTAEARRLTA